MATRTRKVGTCPICFNTQVVRGPVGAEAMVLHGYERPGYGYIHGNCPGYRARCFERSPEATIAFVETLKTGLVRLRARLAEVESPDFRETLYGKRRMPGTRNGKFIYEDVPVTYGTAASYDVRTGHSSWDTLRTRAVEDLKRSVSLQELGINDLSKRIAGWVAAEPKEEEVDTGPTRHWPAARNTTRDPYGWTECFSGFRNSRSHRTLAETKEQVTCSRCRKSLGLDAK